MHPIDCILTAAPLRSEHSLPATLALRFRLSPNEARIFGRLVEYDHATRPELHAVIARGKSATKIKMVDVTVYHLRRKLAPHGIEIINVWGLGFRLAENSRGKIRRLLGEPRRGSVAATTPAGPVDPKGTESEAA